MLTPDTEGAAVLLVNDEPAQLFAMEATLAASGYRVERANSGREALRLLLARDDFAVVVLDVRMPDLNGFETAELIRQHPRTESLPIIFATAMAVDPADARRGYALGAVEYLIAPFDATALRAKVAVFVDLFRKSLAVREQAQKLAELNRRLSQALAEAAHINEALAREVEQRREAEEALTEKARQLEGAVQELEAYDYSIAHDLRTPLRAIHGFTSIVATSESERLSADSRSYLDRVLHATRRMSDLIDALLAVSRASRAALTPSQVDLSTMAREIARWFADAEPGRVVEVAVQDGMSAWGDPRLLHTVLQNLIDNAWKFTRDMPHGHIEVGARPEGDGTTFFVRDDGQGFDTKHTHELFQTFRTLHNRGGSAAGTGIGLATVRRIVQRHGGRVWAAGEPGKGATFYFHLPAAPSPDV